MGFFFAQFNDWQERWKGLYESTADENEIAAGIEKLQAFEWFATLDALAKGDVTKYDTILDTEANVIYTKLLKDKTENEYVENLRKYNEFVNKGKQ